MHYHSNIQAAVERQIAICKTRVDNCVVKTLKITSGPPSYLSLLGQLDNNDNTTLLILEYKPDAIDSSVLIQVDRALAQRPWWFVEAEYFCESQFVLIVRHVPLRLSIFLRSLVHQMFPAEKRCAVVPLEVSNHADYTWGNRWAVAIWEAERSIDDSTIFHILVKAMDPDQKGVVYFAGEHECSWHHNKWDCLFLPTTNCSIPTRLATCEPSYRACYPLDLTVYLNATLKGEILDYDILNDNTKLRNFIKEVSFPRLPVVDVPFKDGNNGQYTAYHQLQVPDMLSMATSIPFTKETSDQLSKGYLYYLGMATRFNSFFRLRVQAVVTKFRSSFTPPFEESTPCVAVHIRQDDRRLPNVTDMSEWCNRCSIMNEDNITRSRYKDGCVHYDEPIWSDMGCTARLPFGKASLVHYINASAIVAPNINNLFIMTDDIDWLHAEKKHHATFLDALYREKGLQLFTFPVRPKHRRMALKGAEDFWASVTVAQQCSGFVGHFGSSATQIIYRQLCYRSNHTFLQCPDVVDLGD